MIADPVRTPAPDPRDYRTTAFAAIQTSDENALRLLIAWCNYDAVREGYLSAGSRVTSEKPRCTQLRAYLASLPAAEQARLAGEPAP